VSVEDEQRAFADALARSIGAVFFGVLALGLEIGERRKMQVPMAGKGRTGRTASGTQVL
jgi:hypothetical protein